MDRELEQRATSRIVWRIVPFAMLLFVISYVDRANVSFAALQMNKDLGFTASVYGLGAGIFFLGFFPFEIPSNLILARIGARRWIAAIMIAWGTVGVAMAWIADETSFYVMRFLLGVAESGFLPGIILYFSYWFPARVRAKSLGLFLASTAIANFLGAPLAAAILGFDGFLGFRGWQALFIIEGIPAVLLGLVTLYYLTDRPVDASWLGDDERVWLIKQLETERIAKESTGHMTLLRGLTDPLVLMLIPLAFLIVTGNYSVVFWMPQIIQGFANLSNIQIGLLAALPYALAMVAMVWWGRRSDRVGDRKWHLAVAALVGSSGLAGAAMAPAPIFAYVGLCVATVGIWSTFGVFWAIPGDYLSGTAAAGAFALVNSFGTLGGFVGPFLVGFLRDKTGSFTLSLMALALIVLGVAVLSSFLPSKKNEAGVVAHQA